MLQPHIQAYLYTKEGRSISIRMCTAALTPTAKKQNNPNVHILNHNKAKNPAILPSTDGNRGSWVKSNRLGTLKTKYYKITGMYNLKTLLSQK